MSGSNSNCTLGGLPVGDIRTQAKQRPNGWTTKYSVLQRSERPLSLHLPCWFLSLPIPSKEITQPRICLCNGTDHLPHWLETKPSRSQIGLLQMQKSQFVRAWTYKPQKNRKLFPLWNHDGTATWCYVMTYYCPHCKTRIAWMMDSSWWDFLRTYVKFIQWNQGLLMEPSTLIPQPRMNLIASWKLMAMVTSAARRCFGWVPWNTPGPWSTTCPPTQPSDFHHTANGQRHILHLAKPSGNIMCLQNSHPISHMDTATLSDTIGSFRASKPLVQLLLTGPFKSPRTICFQGKRLALQCVLTLER